MLAWRPAAYSNFLVTVKQGEDMRYEASYMLILIYASYCTAKHSYIEYEVSTSASTAALPVTAISNGRTSCVHI